MISTRRFHATTLLFLAATCVTAAAEDQTIGFRLIVHTIEAKVLQAPGPEGRIIGVQDSKGSAVFDDGRLADKTFVYSFDLDKGVGSGRGYSVYSFVDGSTIAAIFRPRQTPMEPPASIR